MNSSALWGTWCLVSMTVPAEVIFVWQTRMVSGFPECLEEEEEGRRAGGSLNARQERNEK